MAVRCRRTFLLAVLLMLLATPAWAQSGAIAGRVTSADGALPLPNALVRALNASQQEVSSALSGQNGTFRLTGLAPGSYVVSASAVGYAEQRTSPVQVTAGGTASVDITMQPSAFELNPVVVSVSKQGEKALEAPARVEVIEETRIEARPTVTPVDHLRSTPGVDVITQGLQSTNVVVRGFNNIFSGALHTLTDNRIAGVPSLRVNVMHFVPSTDDDLQRIEVVLGPGSALYGPNTASGVMHMITKSPLLDQGSSLSVAGGERSVLHVVGRTSHMVGETFGFKVSGSFLRGDEWEFIDPVEVAEQTKFASNPAFWTNDLALAAGITPAEAAERIARVGERNFDVERWGGEARADWRITDELTSIFTAGMTNVGSGIELTGLGAAQVEDWRYSFYQARANWRRLFVQAYLNASDAGDTFLLRNGTPIVDKSKLYVAQAQHGFGIGERQNFTYGIDWLFTKPETEGTINGIYEEDDETTEFGGYLQSETALTTKLNLVLAGRVDTHSALPDAIFSPRAALVFSPTADHAFRVTFNRAFSTPTSLNQFLDLGTPIPVEAAARLGYSVRVQGTGETGFTFRQSDGTFRVRSPFAPDRTALLPAVATNFWAAAVNVLAQASGMPNDLRLFLLSQQPTAQQVGTNFNIPGTTVGGPIDQLQLPDIDPIRESTTTAFEAGYKGILAERLLLAADVWYEKRQDLVTPLTTFTPFIVHNPQDLAAYLGPRLAAIGVPQAQAAQIIAGLASVPVGVIGAPEMNVTGAQLLATYTNVGDELDLWGVDLSGEAILSDTWSLAATASFVNEDAIETAQGLTVTLNAPKTKGSTSLRYRSTAIGLSGEARVRFNEGFPAISGVYEGTDCLPNAPSSALPCVESATLVDLNLEYRLPTFAGASVALGIQNLLDEDYVSFPGVPPVGRMALLRLKYAF